MNIGFIGLGIMGRPMAKNLLRCGEPLWVCDLQPAPVKELCSLGARQATAAEIGQTCELIFTILPNGEVVQQVLFAKDGVAAGLTPGALVVDMSSVTPEQSRHCAKRLKEAGVGFLDAPVSGGEPKAIDGTLAIMVGGDEADFARARPYLLQMGASAVYIGDCGTGSATKLANQIIVNLTIAAVSEAFVLAKKAGADPTRVYEAIRGGLAGSTALDAKLPLMVARQFAPGGKISINRKDIGNVLATGHSLNVPLPLSAQLYEILQALTVAGHLEEDHSAIVRYFEQLAGLTVGEEAVE